MTPELLASEDFLKVMADVKETTVDSVDVAEDMFGGVEQAILQTKWRPESVRVVILVGDAPSHKLGHKWNSTGKDETTLRPIATENKVAIFSLHVKPGVNKKYNTLAETQFKALAVNPGSDIPMYWPFSSKEREQFAATTSKIGSALIEHMKRAVAGTVFAESATPSAEGSPAASAPQATASQTPASDAQPESEAVGPSKEQILQALQAATVTWLGSKLNVEPPRDIEAWVADKDLLTPSVQSLEVRLLVSKRQLDSLAVMLNEIVAAGRENQSSSDDFFTSLQGVSAAASRNADQIAKATTLQEAGLVPAFLEGLPYKSQIMSMSSELWSSWGPDEQDQFIENLVSKVEAYKTLHNTPDNWVSLNAGDSADDHVTPIPLELLP